MTLELYLQVQALIQLHINTLVAVATATMHGIVLIYRSNPVRYPFSLSYAVGIVIQLCSQLRHYVA
jgi:hypothetical protein